MKDRWLTLMLALAALTCFYILLFPGAGAEPRAPPLSGEAGPSGYLGAWRWLAAEHIPLSSLRRRYDALQSSAVTTASGGNLLITTLPQRLPLQRAEWDQLEQWIDRGNTLLIMAALDDMPPWALRSNAESLSLLQQLARLRFSPTKQSIGLQQWLGPQTIAFVALGAHPLLRHVGALEAESAFPAMHWHAQPIDGSMPLVLGRRAQSDQSVLWLENHGHGQIIVSAFATPFNNHELARADNAQLLSNIVAWSRSAGGSVIFDDAHQGQVDFYDAAAFFGDPRLHRSLLWMLLLWLVFVLGPQRLRSSAADWHATDETALIRASGRFYSGAVAPQDARRALFENFFNLLRQRLGLPQNGEPPWEWLGAQAAISPEQRLELQQLYARNCADQRISLRRLHNLLSTLQGQLM